MQSCESESYLKQFNEKDSISYDFSSVSEIIKNPLAKRNFIKKMSTSHSLHVMRIFSNFDFF